MNQLADALRSVGAVRKCWPKPQCPSRGAAEAQLRSVMRRGLDRDPSTVNVYRCRACGCWHVGHVRKASDGV